MDSICKGKLSPGEILILPTWQGSHPPFYSPHITQCTSWLMDQVEGGRNKVLNIIKFNVTNNNLYELHYLRWQGLSYVVLVTSIFTFCCPRLPRPLGCEYTWGAGSIWLVEWYVLKKGYFLLNPSLIPCVRETLGSLLISMMTLPLAATFSQARPASS